MTFPFHIIIDTSSLMNLDDLLDAKFPDRYHVTILRDIRGELAGLSKGKRSVGAKATWVLNMLETLQERFPLNNDITWQVKEFPIQDIAEIDRILVQKCQEYDDAQFGRLSYPDKKSLLAAVYSHEGSAYNSTILVTEDWTQRVLAHRNGIEVYGVEDLRFWQDITRS